MYVIVVGGGKVGYYLSKHLLDRGYEVTLIEKDPRRAEVLNSVLGEIVMVGTATRWHSSPPRAWSGPTSWWRSPVTTRTTWCRASWRSGNSTYPRPSPASTTRPTCGSSRPWGSTWR